MTIQKTCDTKLLCYLASHVFIFLYKFFYVVIQLYILLSVYLAVSATNTSISYNDFMSVKLNSSADVV